MNKNPLFYKGLIWCFGTLYALVAFISFWHCIAFCLVGNPAWISVMMSFAFEVGLAATLFSILTTDNKNNYVAWILMTFLTGVQVIGNVYSVFKYMVESGTKFYTYIQDSMLHWFVEDVPNNEIMSIIAIILGALLPIVALLMTAMVSNNLKMWLTKKEEGTMPLPSSPIPDNKFSNEPEVPNQEEQHTQEEEIPQEELAPVEGMIRGDYVGGTEEDLAKSREEFYKALEEFAESNPPSGILEESQEEPDSSDDFNLDFKEEDRSNETPIQDVVVEPQVADVSILDIDNEPTIENATETLNSQAPKSGKLKGIVEGTEDPVDIRNSKNPSLVGNSGKEQVISEDQTTDSSVIDPTPLEDTIKKNVEVIQQKQGPFSLFKPGN